MLGAIYRLTIAFIICLIPIRWIFHSVVAGEELDPESWFFIGVVYLLAISAFFGYELIMTKKLVMLKKALPSLLILPLLNLVVIVGMVFIYRSAMRFQPEPEEICAVRVEENTNSSFLSYYFDGPDYFESQTKELEITDPEAIRAAVKGLQDTLRNKRNINPSTTVAYKTQSGRWVYRKIDLDDENTAAIEEARKANPEYKKIYTDLPANENGLTVSMMYSNLDAADRARAEAWSGRDPHENIREIHALARQFEGRETAYVSHAVITVDAYDSNYFPKADLEELIPHPFEGTELFIPAGYDDFLTREYGNYMEFPPVEKRNSGHHAVPGERNTRQLLQAEGQHPLHQEGHGPPGRRGGSAGAHRPGRQVREPGGKHRHAESGTGKIS